MAIIDAYSKFPEVFRRSGVLPTDIEKGNKILLSLNAADLVQENAKANKKRVTAERNV